MIRNRSAQCPCRSFREVQPSRGQLRGCLGIVSVAYGVALGGLWVLWTVLRGL